MATDSHEGPRTATRRRARRRRPAGPIVLAAAEVLHFRLGPRGLWMCDVRAYLKAWTRTQQDAAMELLIRRGVARLAYHEHGGPGLVKGGSGKPLRLHRHQVEAIRAAKTGGSYVLTTGTGSGKSLAYLVPIVDHALRTGAGRGIQAIVVYPMNALASLARAVRADEPTSSRRSPRPISQRERVQSPRPCTRAARLRHGGARPPMRHTPDSPCAAIGDGPTTNLRGRHSRLGHGHS